MLVSGGLALWAAWPWLHPRGATADVELRRVVDLPSPFAPSPPQPYWPQIERAAKLRKAALPQTFLSLKYFAYRPEELPIALEAAQLMLGFVQQVCQEHGVRLIVAYLPPVTDVEPEHFGLPLPELCAALDLGPEDLGSTERLAGQLLAWLTRREVEVLDLRPAFRASPESLYWAGDLHIDLAIG